MDRDKLAKLIDKFLIDNEDGFYCKQFADYLIANGIGAITELREMYLKLSSAMDELKQGVFEKRCNYKAKCETDEDYIAMENKLSAEKHRADVAEEALRLMAERCSTTCIFGKDNITDNSEKEISYFKQQAAKRLKELQGNNGK